MNMTPEQALDVVAQMAAKAQGTLADHQITQQALSILQKAIVKEVDDGDTGE